MLRLSKAMTKTARKCSKYRMSPIGDHTGKSRVRNKNADHWTSRVSKAVKGPRLLAEGAEGYMDYTSLWNTGSKLQCNTPVRPSV